MILCGPNFDPNFAVSLGFEAKIIKLLLLPSKSPYFQFETQMASNNDVINVLNILARKEPW